MRVPQFASREATQPSEEPRLPKGRGKAVTIQKARQVPLKAKSHWHHVDGLELHVGLFGIAAVAKHACCPTPKPNARWLERLSQFACLRPGDQHWLDSEQHTCQNYI